jgi:hypothetical protein
MNGVAGRSFGLSVGSQACFRLLLVKYAFQSSAARPMLVQGCNLYACAMLPCHCTLDLWTRHLVRVSSIGPW